MRIKDALKPLARQRPLLDQIDALARLDGIKTQAALAERLGLSKRVLCGALRGTAPSLPAFRAVASWAGIGLEELIAEVERDHVARQAAEAFED